MTAALARNAASNRLPERAAATAPAQDTERAKVPAKAEPKPRNAAAEAVRDGAKELDKEAVATPSERAKKAAKARPGAGVDEIRPPKPTRQDRQMTRLADQADRVFSRLVQQREKIERARDFGDTEAMHQAFGRARELFAKLISIANEAQINMSSNVDSEAVTDAKRRISERVRDGYTWAGLIEEAMPGDQTV